MIASYHRYRDIIRAGNSRRRLGCRRWLLALLAIVLLCGCNLGDSDGFDREREPESWEFLPFNGRLQFEVLDAHNKEPIPNATLQVEHLPIEELRDVDMVSSDAQGFILVHQLQPGITYLGEGPAPAIFIFAAPGYETRAFSVQELADEAAYDPFSDEGLPRAEYEFASGDVEDVALYAFEIHLSPDEEGQ